MKQILRIFAIFLLVGLTNSCQEDFLKLEPLSDYSDAAVWGDPALIETFVNNISNKTPLPVECVLGYLLSTYKNKMNNKAMPS